jgi:phosphate-selective porin OprO/OprP
MENIMRRVLLIAAFWLLSMAYVYGQQAPVPAPQPATNASVIATAPSASIQADEIQALKASILQLQQRLDQLSAPAVNTDQSSARRPLVYPLSPIEQGLNHSTLVDEVASLPDPATKGTDWPLAARWDNGLQLASREEIFRVHVGGTLQFDYGWNAASQSVQFGPGGIGDLQDGALLRRARIRIDGTMYEHVEWVAEYDFANTVENDNGTSTQTIGTPSFINAWIGINDLPLAGTIHVGWLKEPIGFDFINSGRWLNFMERTPGTNSFFTRSVGALLLNKSENERLTWAFGIFHSENDNFGFGFGDGQYAEVGRITWLPVYEDEGQRLLHLGLGAKHGHLDSNQIDFRGRPSVRTMPGSQEPALADTGAIGGSNQDILDVEFAAVYGPWTLQSEYYCTFIHDSIFPNKPPPEGAPLGTLFYQGAYLEVLYFLTGEYQPYDRKLATFGRVIPRRNFNIWSGEPGCGAWQVGIRYGYLDLQNKGVNGATLNDLVLGLNWFLNPNAKLQWNLAIDHRESTPPGSSGWTYIFGGRVAVDF